MTVTELKQKLEEDNLTGILTEKTELDIDLNDDKKFLDYRTGRGDIISVYRKVISYPGF